MITSNLFGYINGQYLNLIKNVLNLLSNVPSKDRDLIAYMNREYVSFSSKLLKILIAICFQLSISHLLFALSARSVVKLQQAW